ncbi:hypothetical protein C2G38_2187340, partial [Gigaspora rosea]
MLGAIMDKLNELSKKMNRIERCLSEMDDRFSEMEDYLAENHTEFYDSLTDKKWNTYYKKNIAQPLLKQHRSLRSALTTRVKDAMFSVFGESQLDSINTNATPADVSQWKASAKMKACYQKLFKPISSDPNDSYMSRILNKSSRKGKHVRRTKSPINISDTETSQATPEATPEATQEEPPEGSTA